MTMINNLYISNLLRFWAIIFCALLFVIPKTAFGQTRNLEIEHRSGKAGQKLKVPIHIDNANDILGLKLKINFPDTSSDYPLEFLDFETSGTLLNGWVMVKNNASKSRGLTILSAARTLPMQGSGKIILLHIKIKENATPQTVPLEFHSGTTLNDGAIPVNLVNGAIEIQEGHVTPSPTSNPTPTVTPSPSPSPSQSPTLTATPIPTSTPSPTVVPTDMPSPTREPSITPSFTNTPMPASTPTQTLTSTPTLSPAPTWTLTPSLTQTPAVFSTPTFTHTPAATHTPTSSPTNTFLPTFTPTSYHTATPTSTPTIPFGKVIVCDSINTFEDLSGGVDYDTEGEEDLVIRWNFNIPGIKDIHIYVLIKGTLVPHFLGRTGDGNATYLEWKKGNPLIKNSFRQGPQLGESYLFSVFFLTWSGKPFVFGPFLNAGFVEMAETTTPTLTPSNQTPTATPTFTPSPTPTNTPTSTPTSVPGIIVTDTQHTTEDLSHHEDRDPANRRQLCIQWSFTHFPFNPSDIADTYIYVKENNHCFYRLLGRTGDPHATYYTWSESSRLIVSRYRKGPAYNNFYHFKVLFRNRHGRPFFFGPYYTSGPVKYMSNVRITDDAQSTEDLSGYADFDTPDNRELVIQWDMSETGIDPIDIKRYHIYLITPDSEPESGTFFADTRIGDATSIQWYPGNSLIAPRFSNGPQFNTSYKFAIYALTHSSSPNAHGPFENSAYVEYYRIREP